MCKATKYHGTSNTRIDKCMRPLIKWLKGNWTVVACCCGHNKYSMTVIVKYCYNGVPVFKDLFTHTTIPRSRNFYKRDEEGIYYIPEVNPSEEEICECGHTQWSEHKSSFYEYKGLKMKAQECNVKGCKCQKFKKANTKNSKKGNEG